MACNHIAAEHWQAPPTPQPQPPPDIGSMFPILSLANAANTDNALCALDPQFGHIEASRDVVIGLIFSNLLRHLLHVYSYMGILWAYLSNLICCSFEGSRVATGSFDS